MIPKSGFTADINGNIYITGKCAIYPIFYGESGNPATQDYIVTYDPYGDDSTVTSLNIKTDTAKIQINKTDDFTHKPIKNVTFELTKADGTVIGRATTNDEGIAIFEKLYQGSYIAREVETNEKYILRTDNFNVNTAFNKTSTLNVENEHKKGNLKVYKVDKDNNKVVLGNVEFDLYSHEFKRVIGTYRTDVNGEIYIENLRIGDYSLIEKETNRWYNLADDAEVKVEWKVTTDAVVENELQKGQIKVVKIDTDNKEVKLEGVTFELYNANHELLETLVTDKNGEATTKRYSVRDFEKLYLKETKTLDNYVLNAEEKEIVLQPNEITNITFENEKKKGQLEVIKVDKDNKEVKLKDVTFEVYDEKDNLVDTLVTNEEGKAVTKRLPIDQEYTVKETITNEKYVLNDKPVKVTLEQDKIKSMTFENEIRKGQIEVIKVDGENKEVKLEGVTFEVVNSDNKVVDTIVTDKDGKATSKKLSIYDEYTIREKETLKEYILSDKTEKVVLEENEITSIIFENVKKKGSIKILKLSDGFNELLNIPDGTPLAGAKFDIRNSNGELIGIFETNNEGIILVENLPYGEYVVAEIGAPEGYVITHEPKIVSIVDDGQVVEVVMKNSPVLPKTGSDFNVIPMIISAIIFVLMVGIIMAKIKMKERE